HEFAPRVSLSRKWKNWTVYSGIAKGFSPPTSAELVPSGSAINLSLQPEEGTNYELGFRGKWKDVSVDVNGFFFRLKNTIVQRRDAGGGDYFVNAGKTNQHGLETMLSIPLPKSFSFLRQSQAWLSHTYHHFRYADFKQLTNDFSGKRLPGVAPHTISTGIDLTTRNGLLGSFSYYFSDKIPLNDANSEYAASYILLHAKIGYEKLLASKLRATLVIGAENLLNEKYSLGNDINGFGGRYYNAAPGRSFYTSLTLQLLTKQ
ncbi:MAG: TonB-dependent receptor, partial [Chitinophagaceae bacterium]